TTVWGCAKLSGLKIPPNFLFANVQFFDPSVEVFITFFSLGTPYNLANSREQNVHGSDGFPVFVLTHIESLDLCWVVCEDYRLHEVLFYKITFMLGLEIGTPGFYWELELLFLVGLGVFEDFYGFGIGKSLKLVVDNKVEFFQQCEWALVFLLFVFILVQCTLVKERKVLFAVVQCILNKVLEELLR